MRNDDFCRKGLRDQGGRALIPLTYYTWENSDVGNERLSFEVVVYSEKLPPNQIYAVRFYIHSKGRLHRVVQTTFDTFAKAA
jgi:hypothetical protein